LFTYSSYLDNPIFVVGVDRSGTTLLNMMLDAHPDLFITYEQRTIITFYKKLTSYGDLSVEKNRIALITDILADKNVTVNFPNTSLSDFNLDECQSFACIIKNLYGLALKGQGKLMWGDKDPIYTQHIEILNEIFPNAKFIHLVRDGRDVALSLITKKWGPKTFTNAIMYWERTIHMTRRLLKMVDNGQTIELMYEDLVKAPEANLRKLCKFLQLEYNDKMLNSYSAKAKDNKQVNDRIAGIHKNILDKPDTNQIFKWKINLSAVDQAISWEHANQELSYYKYESGVKSHKMKIFKKFYFFLKEAYLYRLTRDKT
jgi:hypothetical protein